MQLLYCTCFPLCRRCGRVIMWSAAAASHDSHASQVSPLQIACVDTVIGKDFITTWSCSDLICLRRFTAYSCGFTLRSSLCAEPIIIVKDDSEGTGPASLSVTEITCIFLVKPYYEKLLSDVDHYYTWVAKKNKLSAQNWPYLLWSSAALFHRFLAAFLNAHIKPIWGAQH